MISNCLLWFSAAIIMYAQSSKSSLLYEHIFSCRRQHLNSFFSSGLSVCWHRKIQFGSQISESAKNRSLEFGIQVANGVDQGPIVNDFAIFTFQGAFYHVFHFHSCVPFIMFKVSMFGSPDNLFSKRKTASRGDNDE